MIKMRFTCVPAAVCALVLGISWTVAQPAADELGIQVIAEVNGEQITAKEAFEPIQDRIAELKERAGDPKVDQFVYELKKYALQQKINELLLVQDALNELGEPGEEEVEDKLNAFVNSLVAPLGTIFLVEWDIWQRKGHTLEEEKAIRKRQLLLEYELDRKVRSKITSIPPAELRKYYVEHKQDYTQEKEVKFRQIMIPFSWYGSKEETRQVAESVMGQLREGQDFGSVAKDRSRGPRAQEGGLWDFVRKEVLKYSEVDEALFSLREREMSDIIETELGFFIVKVEEIKPHRVATFEDKQEEIGNLLYKEKFNQAYSQLLVELRSKALWRITWAEFYRRELPRLSSQGAEALEPQ